MSKPIEDYTMRELRQELDAERTTKNILRDTYEKLEQELADTKKKLEDVVKQYERVMNEVLHLRGLRYDLEAFKKEALELIKFYAEGSSNMDYWKDDSLGYFRGKRARSFLKRCEQSELLQKHKVTEQLQNEQNSTKKDEKKPSGDIEKMEG